MEDKMNDLIIRLKELAARETLYEGEDCSAYEASGGNYDDAHYLGVKDGMTELAREVLTILGETY